MTSWLYCLNVQLRYGDRRKILVVCLFVKSGGKRGTYIWNRANDFIDAEGVRSLLSESISVLKWSNYGDRERSHKSVQPMRLMSSKVVIALDRVNGEL